MAARASEPTMVVTITRRKRIGVRAPAIEHRQQDFRLWTTEQVAEAFGVDPKTVSAWRRDRGMPHFKLGYVVRFDPQEIIEWLKLYTHRSVAEGDE